MSSETEQRRGGGMAAHGSGLTTTADEDLSLPRITVEKIIAESLPAPMQRSKEFTDLVMNCTLEFLTLLSTAAQDICDKDNKKIMNPEHVLQAIQDLGFSEYLLELHDLTDDVKVNTAKERQKKNSRFNHGMTDEELLAKQAALFAQAQQATGYRPEPEPSVSKIDTPAEGVSDVKTTNLKAEDAQIAAAPKETPSNETMQAPAVDPQPATDFKPAPSTDALPDLKPVETTITMDEKSNLGVQ